MLILYLSFSACTTWRADTLTPQAVVESHPLTMRVTYKDSSMVVIDYPQLHGDTIVGPDPKMNHVRVPLDSVLLTETRHGDAGTTVLVVLGVTAALAAVAAIVFAISCNQSNCFEMQR